MEWRLPARRRAEALDAKVVAFTDRLDAMMARVDGLVGDVDRLSSRLDELGQLLQTEMADRREQADRLASLRDRVGELQSDGRTTMGAIAELRQSSRSTLDAVNGQASSLDDLRNRDDEQGRSLDQVRADLTRIERQGAVDLAELRATDTALARMVLKAERREGASPE